ncbi:hypothetical protein CFBP6762_02232 [Xanthomonas arboricola pv. fragariae]|nr:hypothetical protein CFBP6762_02232 [Xanthomonas arboricola pv. fragariae]
MTLNRPGRHYYASDLACGVAKQRATNRNQGGPKSNCQFDSIGAVGCDLLPRRWGKFLELHNLQALIEPIQARNKAIRDSASMPEQMEFWLESAKGLGSLKTVSWHFLHCAPIHPFDLVLEIFCAPSIARDIRLDRSCHNTSACKIVRNALGVLLLFLPIGDGDRYRDSENASDGLHPSGPFRRLMISRRCKTLDCWWIDQGPCEQASEAKSDHRNDEKVAIRDGAGHVAFLFRHQSIVGHTRRSSRFAYAT